MLVLIGLGAIAGVVAGGRVADGMIRHGRVNARVLVAASGFAISALLFVPGLLLPTLAAAAFVYLLAAALAAPNPALDAARLDVVPSWLWGRAEAVRTVLRGLLQAAAPILFGYLSDVLSGRAGSAPPGGGSTVASAAASGLTWAFLIMLVPLAAAGLVLLLALRTYPNDLVTAAASDRSRVAAAGSPGMRETAAARLARSWSRAAPVLMPSRHVSQAPSLEPVPALERSVDSHRDALVACVVRMEAQPGAGE